jgi:hypothetical protein
MAVEKGVKMSSQLHYLPYFTSAVFFLELRVASELASCLLTQGTFKKSYRRVCRRLPAVDRALQKTLILVVTMPKLVSLNGLFKINSFQVMPPCALVS